MFAALRRNSLSIISIFIAISALSYNTWRNQLTESNRNVRVAGFEILKNLAELQMICDLAYYDKDTKKGNTTVGWTRVLFIEDLTQVMTPELSSEAQNLHQVWQDNAQDLLASEEANKHISSAIFQMRKRVLDCVGTLN